jgi:hypothetical protein
LEAFWQYFRRVPSTECRIRRPGESAIFPVICVERQKRMHLREKYKEGDEQEIIKNTIGIIEFL